MLQDILKASQIRMEIRWAEREENLSVICIEVDDWKGSLIFQIQQVKWYSYIGAHNPASEKVNNLFLVIWNGCILTVQDQFKCIGCSFSVLTYCVMYRVQWTIIVQTRCNQCTKKLARLSFTRSSKWKKVSTLSTLVSTLLVHVFPNFNVKISQAKRKRTYFTPDCQAMSSGVDKGDLRGLVPISIFLLKISTRDLGK